MKLVFQALLATSAFAVAFGENSEHHHSDYPARANVFIDTDELDNMIQVRSESDLKIFDCTVADDALISYHQSHVPGAGFIDLNYFRNMTNKYPFMIPGA